MVKSCSAYGCTNRFSKNGISFHKFPLKDKSLLRKWIVATKNENFNLPSIALAKMKVLKVIRVNTAANEIEIAFSGINPL